MNERTHPNRLRGLCVLLAWLGALTIAWAEAVPAFAADSGPVRKIVRQYALTSANDFPQRDPRDWRLLASNDGGQTWTVLDVRTGELFSERHQRRLFDCTNHMAFNIYRLEIDQVRDPETADAVQLAQIEPLGETPADASPTPLFCDRITAQGENPPTEGVGKAFDNQVQTKWLDMASQNPKTRASWVQWQYLDHSGLTITNLEQLHSLNTRADEGYAIEIAAMSLGQLPGTQQLCLMDGTGHVEVDLTGQTGEYPPGQQVLLRGISEWRNRQPGVRHLHLEPTGPVAPGKPRWIEPGQAVAPGESWQWVETGGEVQFVALADNGLTFEVMENGRSIFVHVQNFKPGQYRPVAGAQVRASGLMDGVLDENGRRVAGLLWLAGAAAITPITQTNLTAGGSDGASHPVVLSTAGAVLTEIDQIRHLTQSELAQNPAVKIRGVITEVSGNYLQDGTGGIEFWTDLIPDGRIQSLGSYVEVEGLAIAAYGHGLTGNGPIVRALKLRNLGRGKLPPPFHPSWSLLASGQMDAQWVEVDAVVRATDGSHLLLACESGQLMATIRSAPVADVTNLVDASVRVRGVSVAASDARGQMQGVQLVVPSLEFIDVQQPPAANSNLALVKMNTLLQVRGPKELIHRIKVQGVLTGYADNNYFIQDESGSVMAIAEQEVILNLPPGGWWSFWQNPKNTNSPVATSLRVGDQVEAVGFPEIRGYGPVLTEAMLQKIGPAAAVAPVTTTVTRLANGELDSTLVTLNGLVLGSEELGNVFVLQVQSDQKIFQALLTLPPGLAAPKIVSGSRVAITGVCQMEPAVHAELGKSPSAFTILLRSTADIAVVERPPWLTVQKVLLATGALLVVLLAAFVWIRQLHQQVESRTLLLKQEIAEHEKTEALLDGKTRLLQLEIAEHEQTEATLAEKTELLKAEIRQRQSIYDELEEKKRSLEREIEERKRAQLEIEKIHKQLLITSRFAGMAEVATNVLHNVGNVLNGVNVLASAIVTQLQKSKVSGVSRLAGLLAQHQADLGHFVTSDAAGKHVPGHLERLGIHLTEEQFKLMNKATLLMESVQHIKEIVAMQQNYAKVSGIWETVTPAEIVEDALKLCGEALTRHEIVVIRDYEDTPPGMLDRHKVLQILFNLIDNAKNACMEHNGSPRHVTVKIRRLEKQRVRVEIADNGIGIRPENLRYIFTQGFSTRKEGHGFGLHSSVLASQDMGGSLTVHSTGQGAGATFLLDLPLNLKNPGGLTEAVPKILVN